MFLPDKNLMPTPDAVTHDPFTLEKLIAFCAGKPANEEYCYLDSGECLHGQYLRHIGVPCNGVAGHWWTDQDGNRHALAEDMIDIAVFEPRTFGAALARARAYAAVSA